MASTSSTNAAAAPRTTSDDDERGKLFFGRAIGTLVELGLEGGPGGPSPDDASAHAIGQS